MDIQRVEGPVGSRGSGGPCFLSIWRPSLDPGDTKYAAHALSSHLRPKSPEEVFQESENENVVIEGDVLQALDLLGQVLPKEGKISSILRYSLYR